MDDWEQVEYVTCSGCGIRLFEGVLHICQGKKPETFSSKWQPVHMPYLKKREERMNEITCSLHKVMFFIDSQGERYCVHCDEEFGLLADQLAKS